MIEIIFQYQHQYITVFLEGLGDRKGGGVVSCHQFYGYHINVGLSYQLLLNQNFVGDSKTYEDVFDGPIKEINKRYVDYPFKSFEVFDGQIILNHDCLWYACNLFAKLVGIQVRELVANPNFSQPIIEHKMAG